MKKSEKKEYTYNDEWGNITPSDRKTLMLILMYFNEAGNHDDAIKLIRNRWVRKIYPLPRTNHPNYNSRKTCRSQYWGLINDIIRKYVIEAPTNNEVITN